MTLPVLLLAYAAGIVIASFFDSPPYPLLFPLTSALLWIGFRRGPVAFPLLVLTVAASGFAAYVLTTTPPAGPVAIRSFASNQPVTVEGRVVAVNPRPNQQWTIDIEVHKGGNGGIMAPVKGGVRLYVAGGDLELRPGDRLRFRTRLSLPRLYGTPGEFNTPRHLAAREIFVTGFIAHSREIAILSGGGGRPADFIHAWRQLVARRIDTTVSPDLAPMVKALSIGEAGTFSPEQRDLLARGGVSHLFAISGQHLTLIALFLYLVVRTLYVRSERLLLYSPPKRLLPFLLLPLLYGYLLLAGAALPTQRAFLCAAAGVCVILGGRNTRPLKILATVAFVMLLAEPLVLFEPAFQLSFAGVFGILIALSRWQDRLSSLSKPARWSADILLSTVAATVATTPIVLYHFHLLAPAGVLTNLVAVPAVGLGAALLAFFGTVLSPVWPYAADLHFKACAFLLKTTMAAVQWVVDFPGLSGWKIYAFFPELAGTFLLAAAAFAPGGTLCRTQIRAGLLALGGLLLVIPVPSARHLTVTAISVGQGESLLLSSPDGKHYLVDGGGSALGNGTFDPGERLIAPTLGRMGVRTLEAVVLTHDHPDHRQGLVHILENFPVGEFWSSIPRADLPAEIDHILRSREIPTRLFPPGWTLVEESTRWKLAIWALAEGANTNDLSLVLYSRHGNDGVLLTGDLEAEGVAHLIADPPPGPVTLLKLPHHGSRRSTPALLLEAFHPQGAFVSAGAGNSFGLPNSDVVEEVERRNIPLSRTDRDGTVRLWSKGEGWRREAWQNGLFR